MTEDSLNCLGTTPECKERFMILVMVGRSVGTHCLRIDVDQDHRRYSMTER